MDIRIDKDKIIEKASMIVSIQSRDLMDSSGKSRYDSVRIQDRDKDLVKSFYSRSLGELTLSLRNFILDRNGDLLTLYINDRSNRGLIFDIESLVDEYMIYKTVSEWMKIKAPDMYEKYQVSAGNTLSVLLEKLYYQNAQPDEDITNSERFSCSLERVNSSTNTRIYEIILFKNIITGDIDKEIFSMYKARKDSPDTLSINLESHSQISVYISKHSKRITERLDVYIRDFKNVNASDNNTERKPSFRYLIEMPCTWNSYNLEQLAEEMHTYIVNASLSDYTRVNYPNESLIFRGAADAAWDNMKHTVSVRRGGVIKPLQPF